jgi:hypothetical protein
LALDHGSWSWLLTKGRDQENYLSRPLVTSVKRPSKQSTTTTKETEAMI